MKKLVLILLGVVFISSIYSFSWDNYTSPVVTNIEKDNESIIVYIDAKTGDEGADKLLVELIENGKVIKSKNLGKSKKTDRKTTFDLSHSGSYSVIVSATKKNEDKVYSSQEYYYLYSYPLFAPTVSAKNEGEGKLLLSWNSIKEASYYTVEVFDDNNKKIEERKTEKEEIVFTSLEEKKTYYFIVSSIRDNEKSSSNKLKKTFSNEKDREWFFTYFGQSTKESLNTYEILDSDDLTLKLYAGNKTDQGGKFTTFHDGISFYYTPIKASEENFTLSATFTVNWIKEIPDGQEGFGILVLDSLGQDGVSSVNHYTNSVGLIATKFEEKINGIKYSAKDTLGARFVTGITPEVLSLGDSGVAEYGKSEGRAYSYDISHNTKSGDVYTLKLVKDNTGYYCIYSIPEEDREWVTDENGEYIRKSYPEEFLLYGPEELLKLDSEYVYLGFAAARWCEVTISDITLTITDPKLDSPRKEREKEKVPLTTSVASPSGFYTTSNYPFVFNSNSNGVLSVKESGTSHYYIKDQRVEANKQYEEYINLLSSSNDLYITFTPDSNYSPGENMVIAQYNEETLQYEENYSTVSLYHSVKVRDIEGTTIYVSPKGFGFNEGTRESPLDIYSAILYSKPGQTIVLTGGTYNLSNQVVIERGNDGTAENKKKLTCDEGERAILKFSRTGTKGGIVLWGDYWILDGFDITSTPDTQKGLQIAGNYNTIKDIQAYKCGDTGIQISGSSQDPYSLWPHDNLVTGCISHDNSDLAQNNADGFAAKLTVGDNNMFTHCIAYSNIDDGWDLYSKIESGPIGKVTIKDCVAYKNGSLSDGSGSGDGNGFKMGGDGISIEHTLENCIAFSNTANGITSNSNPTLIIKNCTLYNNGNRNLTLYGKGSGERSYTVSGLISISGTLSDDIKECPEVESEDNFLCNGNIGLNKNGERLDSNIFKNVEITKPTITIEDYKINMHGLLEQNTQYGAKL